MANKVKYGLKKVVYAVVTETSSGGVTTSSYGEVKDLPGAVAISLSAQASKSVFRADDSDYFVNYGEGSYEGDLEMAVISEDLKKDLGWISRDDYGVAVEATDNYKTAKYIALMFEFDGDEKATRHVLYKCSLSHNPIASQTTGENGQIDPQTETVTVTAIPRADADKYIHAYADSATTATAYSAWYTAVPVPTFTP